MSMPYRTTAVFSALWALRHHDAARWTLGYYGLFMGLGLHTAVMGPTLPALAEQTQTPLGHMGWLLLARAVGSTVGTTLGGRLFDRARGHPVLGMAQLADAVLLALVPIIHWFWLVLGMVAVKGFADGLVNTGANMLLVWMHGEHVGPYMHGLHFCFGLGACLAPLLVAQVIGVAGGYRWVYWTLAAVSLLVSLRLLTFSGNPRPAPHRVPGTNAPVGARLSDPRVISAALFLFCYVGAEVAFGDWIYTYAVALQLASAAGGAYLTAGFWLSFTLGRLLSIPLATRFTPPQMVLAALGTCLSLLTLVIIRPDSRVVLWTVVCGVGFGMGPLWPAGFTLAGQSLPLTASVSGMILLGDSVGGMVLPWLAGQVLDVTGPGALIYLVFGSLVGTGVACGAMRRVRPAVPHTRAPAAPADGPERV
jgi:MFS transporter, FHS family, Na+ dependent glucose transporter 1